MNRDGRSVAGLPDYLDDVRVTELWKRYKADGSRAAREQLTLHYRPLVASVAQRFAMGAPRHVERADLESFGLFGLLDAIEKFDPGRSGSRSRAMPSCGSGEPSSTRSVRWTGCRAGSALVRERSSKRKQISEPALAFALR